MSMDMAMPTVTAMHTAKPMPTVTTLHWRKHTLAVRHRAMRPHQPRVWRGLGRC